MDLHSLPKITKSGKKRLGQGHGSGRVKTSGRGTKGQKARAGRKIRPAVRDLIQSLPKLPKTQRTRKKKIRKKKKEDVKPQ